MSEPSISLTEMVDACKQFGQQHQLEIWNHDELKEYIGQESWEALLETSVNMNSLGFLAVSPAHLAPVLFGGLSSFKTLEAAYRSVVAAGLTPLAWGML